MAAEQGGSDLPGWKVCLWAGIVLLGVSLLGNALVPMFGEPATARGQGVLALGIPVGVVLLVAGVVLWTRWRNFR